MGYKKEVIKGVTWIGILRIVTKALGFVEAIILARILLPSQFGAYGIALLALGLLEVITESGVNVVLVQEDDVDSHVSSAWLVSILRGIFIMSVLLLGSRYIAAFFNSPESLTLLYYISLVPLLRGFINPAIVKLQKELRFAKDFWYRFVVLFVDTFISIAFTYITNNPIGIVIGLVAGVALELILSFILVTPHPNLSFDRKYISKIFNRGKWVTFSSIFDYLFHNADNIAVGRILGSASLGVYQLGYSIAAAPLIEVGRVFVHVTVPVLIQIKNDKKRLMGAYLNTVFTIALITLPFAFVFALLSDMFVFILGEKWAAVTTILPILAVLGFVKAVSLSSTAIFLSKNKQEYTTIITLVNILGLVVSIVPLVVSYGIFGAGLSALVGAMCAVPFIIYYTLKTFSNT